MEKKIKLSKKILQKEWRSFLGCKNLQSGFSLFEMLIAFSLFAVFFVVFASSILSNKKDSQYLNTDLILATLAQQKMHETILAPPTLSDQLTLLKPETKKFENDSSEYSEYKDYTYTIEWKRLELPNMKDLMQLQQQGDASSSGSDAAANSSSSNDPSDANANSSNQALAQGTSMLLQKVHDTLKSLLWQVRITTTHVPSNASFVLSTWIRDPNQKVDLNGDGKDSGSTEKKKRSSNDQTTE